MSVLDSYAWGRVIPHLSSDSLVALVRCGNAALLAKLRPWLTRITLEPRLQLHQTCIDLTVYLQALSLLTRHKSLQELKIPMCKSFSRTQKEIRWDEICPDLEVLHLATDNESIVRSLLFDTSFPRLHSLTLLTIPILTEMPNLPSNLTSLILVESPVVPSSSFLLRLPRTLKTLKIKQTLTTFDSDHLVALYPLRLETLSLNIYLYSRLKTWLFLPPSLISLQLYLRASDMPSTSCTFAELTPNLTRLSTNLLWDLCTASTDNWMETHFGLPRSLRRLKNYLPFEKDHPSQIKLCKAVGPSLTHFSQALNSLDDLRLFPNLLAITFRMNVILTQEAILPPSLTSLFCHRLSADLFESLPRTITSLTFSCEPKFSGGSVWSKLPPRLSWLHLRVYNLPTGCLKDLPSTIRYLGLEKLPLAVKEFVPQDLSALKVETLNLNRFNEIVFDKAASMPSTVYDLTLASPAVEKLLLDPLFGASLPVLRSLNIASSPNGKLPMDVMNHLPASLETLVLSNLGGTLKKENIQSLPRNLEQLTLEGHFAWENYSASLLKFLPPTLQQLKVLAPHPQNFFDFLPRSLYASLD